MSSVLQKFEIGSQWATLDPFLFTAHHNDAYPAGDGRFGPDASSLLGRQIGSDFSGKDGWSMYHGREVPGFPQHPHRGFETITYVRRGFCDHTDSMRAAARFGEGDTQWVTTGSGVVHAEMFPLLNADGENPLELFQIWLNLPAHDKMVPAYFTMLWAEDTPKIVRTDPNKNKTTLTLIAGSFDEHNAQLPPPNSWASKISAGIGIWHISMQANAEFRLPHTESSEINRAIYVFDGSWIDVDGVEVEAGTAAVLRSDVPTKLVAGDAPVDAMVLQGRPIGEPVARYGPFVMNTEAEIQQAFTDYQNTQFGGWPWPTDDPNHGDSTRGRFARHADGRAEQRSGAAATQTGAHSTR